MCCLFEYLIVARLNACLFACLILYCAVCVGVLLVMC